MFETHLTVIGTLITAVNPRRLPDDTSFVSFRMASNERRFDRARDTWTDGDSFYVSVTCWRQLADNVLLTLSVGDPIIVRGRLRTRNYEDKDGRRQSVTELEALAVGPDLARSKARITRMRRDGTPVLSTSATADEAVGAERGEFDRRQDRDEAGPSDDPWQVDAGAGDDAPDVDEQQSGASGPLEVAVGA